MRHLLNTLYILTDDRYLALEGENIVLQEGERTAARFPLHTLEGIACFGYRGISPALMGGMRRAGYLSVLLYAGGAVPGPGLRGDPGERAAAPATVPDGGGPGCRLPHRPQYAYRKGVQLPADPGAGAERSRVAPGRGACTGSLRRTGFFFGGDPWLHGSRRLCGAWKERRPADISVYGANWFSAIGRCFDLMGDPGALPPIPANALLSFAYSLLSKDCVSALEGAGLDAYVGFLHRDPSGAPLLALDLMEELRGPFADRFVLRLINEQMITGRDFDYRENGAVFLNEAGRKRFLEVWQTRKRESVTHPFLREKLPWGLIPFVQALLLARMLRGDLEDYPPFLWK